MCTRWASLVRSSLVATLGVALSCCAPQEPRRPSIPSLDYTRTLKAQGLMQGSAGLDGVGSRTAMATFARGQAAHGMPFASPSARPQQPSRAQLRFASDVFPPEPIEDFPPDARLMEGEGGTPPAPFVESPVEIQRSRAPLVRDYRGPLPLGDPGLSSSLWHESRAANDLFRDHRAFYPMDLITVVIDERAEGLGEADTEVSTESSVSASISSLLGLEDTMMKKNPQVDLNSLISARTDSEFKGEGDTNRRSTLRGHLSAMVVEVLPSGILRVEGERIITINNEEQIMVLSGLVRPRDISSENEVRSSRIANMRIDYYGVGTVGDAQHGGFLGRLVRRYWPF